jgi:hypothetical protein
MAVIVSDSEAKVKPQPAAEKSPFPGLIDRHYQKMRSSGLTMETIRLSCVYTEHEPSRVRELLNGGPAVAPVLVFPHFHHGKQVDYFVVRVDPPYVFPDGRKAKYLMPLGISPYPYFPPLALLIKAINEPRHPLGIIEGMLKALLNTQEGFPTIGLQGTQTWSWRPNEGDPRQLVPDLKLNWQDRLSALIYDADPVRKPLVNHGIAELARLLTEEGARCVLRRPPFGPLGEDGRPIKQGLDNFAVLRGPGALREWGEETYHLAPDRSLDEVRAEMLASRIADGYTGCQYVLERLGYPSERLDLLDRTQTGVGKTHADITATRHHRSLSMTKPDTIQEILDGEAGPRVVHCLPTHAHCEELIEEGARLGQTIVPYPELTKGTCLRYDEASAVMERGLAFQLALCPDCPHREGCPYREQREAADAADYSVMTQARGIHTLSRHGGKRLVFNEMPLDIIRPNYIIERGLEVVELIARTAEYATQDVRLRGFFRHMGRVALILNGWLNSADRSADIPLPEPVEHAPEDVHRGINEAILKLGVGAAPPAEAMRLAVAAACGDLSMVGVAVDERPAAGNAVKIVRKLVGVVKTDLPPGCWISDATADREDVEACLGRKVHDITSKGNLLWHHEVLQIIPTLDVTKGRKPEAVLPILRGLLYDLPHRRIGLLTHSELYETLPKLLSEEDQRRLIKVSYFGSGEDRGSNQWIAECDALIVLGTPRVGAEAIRCHLYRIGKSRRSRGPAMRPAGPRR